jgi:hypothetical protein
MLAVLVLGVFLLRKCSELGGEKANWDCMENYEFGEIRFILFVEWKEGRTDQQRSCVLEVMIEITITRI